MNEDRPGSSKPTVIHAPPEATGDFVPFGRYELLGLIGRGGFGEVHRARHANLKRIVAVKLLRPQHAGDKLFADRFRREMEAIGRVDHPNVVRPLDAGEEEGALFLAMEFVEGLTLEAILHQRKVLPAAEACEIIRQAALGLEAIRQHRLVHRDIKPANLMVARSGTVKILDLGLARLKDQDSKDDLTPSRCLLGTFNYQAPEQADDPRKSDIRADLYSLGCTLFKLLTGKAPFAGPGLDAIHQKLKAHAETPLPETPGVPAEVRSILEKMAAKEPEDRYQTPRQVAEALAPFAAGATLGHLVTEEGLSFLSQEETADADGPSQASFSTPGRSAVTPSGSTPPVWLRRRIWPIAVTLAAAGAAALVAVLVLSRGPRETQADPKPQPPSAPVVPVVAKPAVRDLDSAEPLRWHDLLDREPVPFIWQAGDGLSSRGFDAGLRQFTVSAERNAIFQLGSTTRADFTCRVGIHQKRWTGGAGLFLGLRTLSDSRASYQYFVFHSRTDGMLGKPVFSLVRGLASPARKPDKSWAVPTRNVMSQKIEEPLGEHLLEIKVVGGEVQQVRLNNVELKDLVQPEVNHQFKDCQAGGLGTISVASSSVFREARFLLHGDK